ncbi:hypothetical protein SAMN04489806_1220 [Paramicrobacterium humi]|uniref:Uncharacterized protein n=1 Tax=Paramicrobacterium humi TaxID=640635 RepID=A0A1H4KMX9_9MICO|nr:hypothetical protein [Microbacterium humi]SEB59455.1 hypothetical protein SAMN04489806_1220 [Microbacterium humi]
MAERVSLAARRRLSLFSIVIWIVGLCVVAVVGANALGVGDGGSGSDAAYADDPWLNPHPTLAAHDGDVYSGRTGEVIRLTGLDTSKPVHLHVVEGDFVRASVTGENGSLAFTDVGDDPARFTISEYDQEYIMPPASALELWPEADEPWSIQVTQPALAELSGTVSGIGDAAFVYSGTATSARVSARGEYSLRVTVVAGLVGEQVLSVSGNVDRTIAWADSDAAVFVIDAFEETAWTITVPDEPAPSATPGADEGTP